MKIEERTRDYKNQRSYSGIGMRMDDTVLGSFVIISEAPETLQKLFDQLKTEEDGEFVPNLTTKVLVFPEGTGERA